MSASAYRLAQVNIARLRQPLETPLLAEFVAALAPINALADRSPGFVWRLQTAGGDATGLRVFDDAHLIVNMSTWESLEALADYVYRSPHSDVMRQRRTWFYHMQEVCLALWWMPAEHRPAVKEAEQRLTYLQTHGPSAHAFAFTAPFAAPNRFERLEAREGDLCPA